MNSFVLKILAMFTMLCDHLGDTFYGSFSFLNCIGRISFPLFAFQLCNGYEHTHDKKRYFLRLLLFAVLSQIPFSLFLSIFSNTSIITLNIFFTFLFGFATIYFYEQFHSKFFGLFLVGVISILAQLIHVDYGAWGILVIFCFFVLKDKKRFLIPTYLLLVFVKYLPSILQTNFYYPNILLCLFTMLPLVFLLFYNGKQGPKVKYLFYLFYPLHLILLYLLSTFVIHTIL